MAHPLFPFNVDLFITSAVNELLIALKAIFAISLGLQEVGKGWKL